MKRVRLLVGVLFVSVLGDLTLITYKLIKMHCNKGINMVFKSSVGIVGSNK